MSLLESLNLNNTTGPHPKDHYCESVCVPDVNPLWYNIVVLFLCLSLYTNQAIRITKKVTSYNLVRIALNVLYLVFLTIVGYAIAAVCFIPFITGYLLLLVIQKVAQGVMYLRFGNAMSQSLDMDLVWNSTSKESAPFINIAIHYEGEPNLQRIKDFFIEKILKYQSPTGQRPFRKFTQTFQTYFGYFMWKDCHQFDIENHICSFDLNEVYPNVDDKKCDNENLKCTEQLLCRYISEFGTKLMPTRMPQWQMTQLTKGKNAKDFYIVLKLHHAIGDGMSLMRLFLEHLLDEPLNISLLGPQPSKFMRYLWGFWSVAFVPLALRHLIFRGVNNPLHGKPLTGRKIMVTSEEISLEEVRRIKRVTKTSVTDVLFCCLSYAMEAHFRRSPERFCEPFGNHETPSVEIFFPVGFEDKSAPIKLSNTFAMGVASLPTSIKDEGDELSSTPGLKRLYQTKRNFDFVKSTPEILALYTLATLFLRVLPVPLAQFFFHSEGLTAGVSNIPGPQKVISSWNCPSKSMRFWIPDMSPNGCGVTFISYCDRIHMGFSVDEAFTNSREEVERIIDNFGKALKQLSSETL